MHRRNQNKGNYIRNACLALLVLLVAVCWQNLKAAGEAPAFQEILGLFQGDLYRKVLNTHMPGVTGDTENRKGPKQLGEIFGEMLLGVLPIQSYAMDLKEYDTQVESELTYEMLLAREGEDEKYRDGELIEDGNPAEDSKEDEEQKARKEPEEKGETENGNQGKEGDGKEEEEAEEKDGEDAAEASGLPQSPAPEQSVYISREKLNDFDYLIQHFYVVDKTTTIDGSLLNAQELLAKNMKLTTPSDQPQILIHHTHSQEGYADSNGDVSTSIVAVGEYLTELLRGYGFNVIHDTGAYDIIDHQNAYSYAGPAAQQILAENPSIEVVIDMHRDGIKEGHLVTEVNGKQTAKIMFFNGLSRTAANGNLEYLYNPYLQDNLAFSLQMKLAAEEYYPGFTRANYLKGYRYNLHYVPKSMLVEVGAQTNTLEEAKNAMEPLADLLHKVLAPETSIHKS